MQRKPNETREEYIARRKAANAETKATKRRGWWVHQNASDKQGRPIPYNRAEEERKLAAELAQVRAAQILIAWVFQFIVKPQAEEVSA